MNPEQLVTDAAREAAYKVAAVDEMGGAFADEGEFIEAIINAAAPHIAAQALRLAAEKAFAYEFISGHWLRERADEWEGK